MIYSAALMATKHFKQKKKTCVVCMCLLQALIEAFIKDNIAHSLPNSFRHSVQLELLHKVQQG